MIQKGLIFTLVLLFLVSVVPFIQGEPYSRVNEDFFTVHADSYRYMTDWSVHRTNQTTGEETVAPVFNNVESRDMEPNPLNGPMNSSWPMFGHDALHTGRSSYNTTKNMGQNLWKFPTITMAMSSPTISQDGTIYIGACDFNAVNPNGTLKWSIRKACYTAAVIDNNTVYFGSAVGDNDKFYALYPNGTIKWSFSTTDIRACPVIANDGSIIFGEGDGQKIVALYPNGTRKWEFHTDDVVYSSPAVGYDGTVYCGSHDDHIYALYPNGTLKWSFLTGAWVHGSPSIGVDGTVYCGSDDGYLYALNPENGSVVWQLPIGMSYASPTIGPDGTLYIGVWEKKFYAINPNGTIKWNFDTSPGKVWGSTAALSSDGTLYFGTCDLEWSEGVELIALWTNGTLKWRNPLDTSFSSPAIGCDGTVYIGGGDALGDSCLNAFNEGPLRAEANGPYSTIEGDVVNFDGDVYGGLPPYTYLWDFGEENSSDIEDPLHFYYNQGVYNVTFQVTDSEGNVSIDFTNVTVQPRKPIITLEKPRNVLYVLNLPVFPTKSPIIVGPLTVKISVQEPNLIDHINFYIDDELQTQVTELPYRWLWTGFVFFQQCSLKVIAFNKSGSNATISVSVTRLL
ncbi:MAG: PQQ-binding-like beta-propeller repeat protein [Candidatus Thermoplasmatota archaeon]|nr:PQQ-binding-like beta-propeller repeat protein [Candidatus Thermoplasmatota archaeon]